MPRAWLLVTLASLAASLAPLKSFGKTKGRGIRIQDKKGNKNEAVVELFLGTAELETATVGGFTRSQKCVKVDGCAIYGEMNDQDVTRFSGCLGVICPFAAITVARDATDTRKLADALEAAQRGAYAVGAEKVSGDAKEGPMGGAYKTLEKARGAVGIFGLDEVKVHALVKRQAVQTTSSGEAEFYGGATVVMDGKLLWHLCEWLGYEVARPPRA